MNLFTFLLTENDIVLVQKVILLAFEQLRESGESSSRLDSLHSWKQLTVHRPPPRMGASEISVRFTEMQSQPSHRERASAEDRMLAAVKRLSLAHCETAAYVRCLIISVSVSALEMHMQRQIQELPHSELMASVQFSDKITGRQISRFRETVRQVVRCILLCSIEFGTLNEWHLHQRSAGHGMGKPTAKLIEEASDVYSFLWTMLNK